MKDGEGSKCKAEEPFKDMMQSNVLSLTEYSELTESTCENFSVLKKCKPDVVNVTFQINARLVQTLTCTLLLPPAARSVVGWSTEVPLFGGHSFHLRRLKFRMEVKCVCVCVKVYVCVPAKWLKGGVVMGVACNKKGA